MAALPLPEADTEAVGSGWTLAAALSTARRRRIVANALFLDGNQALSELVRKICLQTH